MKKKTKNFRRDTPIIRSYTKKQSKTYVLFYINFYDVILMLKEFIISYSKLYRHFIEKMLKNVKFMCIFCIQAFSYTKFLHLDI
jgi:hypothetical protein